MLNSEIGDLVKAAKEFYKKNELQAALDLLNKSEVRIDEIGRDANLLKDIYSYKGHIYSDTGHLEEAELYFKKSLEICEKIGDPVFIYKRYDNLASIYILQGKNETAIACLEKGMVLKEANKSFIDIAYSLEQIASLQFSLENNLEGKKTLEKLKAIVDKFELLDHKHNYHYLMGMMLKRDQKILQAIRHYLKAVEFAEGHGQVKIAVRALFNLAELYPLQGKFDKSIILCRKGRAMAAKNSLKLEELYFLVAEAQAETELRNIDKATKLLSEARLKEGVINNAPVRRHITKAEAELFAAEGNYQNAYDTHKKFLTLYEEYYNESTSRTVQEIQAKYEHEKKERELQQSKLLQVESELKALRAQMDPHFIFNALGQMRKELLEGNIDNADRYLVRFSRLLRLILDTTRTPDLALSENLELLHLYIQIEQARQNNRFSYNIKIGKNIEPSRVRVPGMLLQPLIENAVIHGLYNKTDGPGELKIDFTARNGLLKIVIADNGIGRNQSALQKKTGHTSHATSIIRETLALIWKGERDDFFTIRDKVERNGQPNGTEVIVLLPLTRFL
ncbi:MAG: hypothetical protein JWO06_2401 [Bacteroidota bacterium]|nr:hypothetical protein [Bacteroidota bacterium]